MHPLGKIAFFVIIFLGLLIPVCAAQARWKDSTAVDFLDGLFRDPRAGYKDQTMVIGEGEPATVALRELDWWDMRYAHRQQLTIINNSPTQPVPEDYSVFIEFDHADMVATGRSLACGKDIRIVYFNGTSHEQIDRVAETPWKSVSTRVWFRVQAEIPPGGSDSNYWLYYGNSGPGAPPANRSGVYVFWDGFDEALDERWEIPSANWTVVDGQLRFGDEENRTEEVLLSRTDLAEIPPSYENFMLEIKQTLTRGDPPPPGDPVDFRNAAIYFRAESPRSGYAFRATGYDRDTNTGDYLATLWKITPQRGWEPISQAVFTPPSINTQYSIKIIAHGDTIKAYFEEDELINITDPTYTTGRIGIYCNTGCYYHDEVKLRYYMGPGQEPTVRVSPTMENASKYLPSGTYASDVRDTGLPGSIVENVAWAEIPVPNSKVFIYIRASDIRFRKDDPAPSEGGTGPTPEWAIVSFNGGPPTPAVAGRYQQYRIRIENDNRWETPQIDGVAINYPQARGYKRHSGRCLSYWLVASPVIAISLMLVFFTIAFTIGICRRR